MVRAITVYFDESEFGELKNHKGKLSWHDFIMKLVGKWEKKEENKI